MDSNVLAAGGEPSAAEPDAVVSEITGRARADGSDAVELLRDKGIFMEETAV